MPIKEDLESFYDAEAKKYASTRKKHRSDAQRVLEEIKKSGKKTITILEFGCGSGRLLDHLKTLTGVKINYTGVDISKELLKIAKKDVKDSPASLSCAFVHDDITNYIKTLDQESFDFVIAVASFQHIPTVKERIFLMKNFYRVLNYGGEVIMTNRAFSRRFLQKHTMQILKSLGKRIISGGKGSPKDIMVPRSSSPEHQKNHYRFYHLFSLQELKTIADISGFTIQQLIYIDQQGMETPNWTHANNSFLIAKKDIFAIS